MLAVLWGVRIEEELLEEATKEEFRSGSGVGDGVAS
jgi:hypothetical protein